MFEWGDLRHFLAVARNGSTLAAARTLGVNQTTVARRIQALEDALGERLFERASGGYRLTKLGEAMTPLAERVEAGVAEFHRRITQHRPGEQLLRITTNDVLADLLITPWLSEYAERFPDLRLETIVTNDKLDLARGEADIAIRAGRSAPEGGGIVIRRIGGGDWGVYASPDYAARNGVPRSTQDLLKHPIIGVAGPLAGYEPEIWKRLRAQGATIRSASSTIGHIASAVKSGLGVGAIPCVLGEQQGLVPCLVLNELSYNLTMITREDIRSLPHVKAFHDYVVKRVTEVRDMLSPPADIPRE